MGVTKPRVKVPKTVRKGDVITIKTLVRHVMESGQRKNRKTGGRHPRMIINRFVATYNDQPVFSADLEPAIAANPFLQFYARIEESGRFDFLWVDDEGMEYRATRSVTVVDDEESN